MNRLARLCVVATLALAGITACERPPPNPAAEHRKKGNAHLKDKEWKEAAAEYEQSLQADPKQADVWEQKAYAHLQLAEAEKVEEAIIKAAELAPDNAKKNELYRNLASMFIQRQQTEKAEAFFLKAIELNPKDDLALAWVAEIYAQRGNSRKKDPANPELLLKSFEYYDKSIALKPDYAITYVNKRIAVNKYVDYLKKEKDTLEAAAAREKNAATLAELKTKIADSQTQIDTYKKQFDELGQKYAELAKAAKK